MWRVVWYVGLWVVCSGSWSYLNKLPQVGRDSMFYQIDLGLDSINAIPAALADPNSDKYVDMFVISSDRKEVEVVYWSGESERFKKKERVVSEGKGRYISSLAPADFNYDGHLDFLLSTFTLPTNSSSFPTLNNVQETHTIYYSDKSNSNFETSVELNGTSVGGVLIIDANGDLYPDFFSILPDHRTPAFWINQPQTNSFILQEVNSSVDKTYSYHSSGLADINSDCRTDLVILYTSTSNNKLLIQFWLNNNNHNNGSDIIYSLHNQVTLLGIPPPSVPLFSDFDSDGAVDILLGLCYPADSCSVVNEMLIIYNNHPHELCNTPWITKHCTDSNELCSGDANYFGGFINKETREEYTWTIEKKKFGKKRFFRHPHYPLTFHAGDYNLDGYVDLLIPLIDDHGEIRMSMWENNADGSFDICSGSSFDPLNNIPNSFAATFLDLFDHGSNDILVIADMGLNSSNSENEFKIYGLYNNFQNDAFFLKTLGLNGVCASWCDEEGVDKFPDPKPYGVSFAGPVFKFSVTDMSGKKHVRQGSQLSQSSYLSLETPYTIFGLGRTSNYIETFFYGLPAKMDNYYHKWICVIPNSQLVAIPYGQDWTLELYINPSGLTLWVLISVVSCLFFLAVVIALFHWREKREDHIQKKEKNYLFSFSAL